MKKTLTPGSLFFYFVFDVSFPGQRIFPFLIYIHKLPILTLQICNFSTTVL
jgi:hypothetical protein